jgi:hypothetical protein
MRAVGAIPSWHPFPPRTAGLTGNGARAMPVAAAVAPPARYDPRQDKPAALAERVQTGELVAAERTSALPPIDLDRRLFEAVSRTMRADAEGANTGLAAKAVHAYLLAATSGDEIAGLRVDGYA